MKPEVLTRLRNAFAAVALEMLDQVDEGAVSRTFPPPFTSMTADDWREAVRLWRQHASELLPSLPDRPCPGCGGTASRFLFFSYDAHPFHECDDCGCWFLPKQVDSSLFDRLFERSPEAKRLAAHMMRERDREALRDADLARIGGYLDELRPLIKVPAGRTPSYLDTGCGVGHSLRAGRMRGFAVQGVEVDTTAVELARADGLPVATLSDPLPEGPYDLLSFWETLEHITDPLGALQRFVPYLAEDGLVAVTVPNMGSPQARVLRESCSWIHGGYNTPGHVNLFHPRALARLLERAGLTVLEFDGQFSNNPIELAAFLAADTRGAFDALQPPAGDAAGLPGTVAAALTAVWPGVALLERMALASPILKAIACRRGREHQFQDVINERRRGREREMAETARSLMAAEPDYKAMAEALQLEVNKRDQMLLEQQQQINRSIEGRARALARRVLGR